VQTPNIIAYLALALWPVVAWQLWARLDRGQGADLDGAGRLSLVAAVDGL